MPEPTKKPTPDAPEAAPEKSFREQHAEAMRQKMAAGLDADQAEAVIRSQLAHDAALAKAAKEAKEAKQ